MFPHGIPVGWHRNLLLWNGNGAASSELDLTERDGWKEPDHSLSISPRPSLWKQNFG